MTRLLDVPWVVNEESERISTHGGLATMDFCGTETERREAMRLVAQAQEMARVLKELKRGLRGTSFESKIDDVLRAAGVLP